LWGEGSSPRRRACCLDCIFCRHCTIRLPVLRHNGCHGRTTCKGNLPWHGHADRTPGKGFPKESLRQCWQCVQVPVAGFEGIPAAVQLSSSQVVACDTITSLGASNRGLCMHLAPPAAGPASSLCVPGCLNLIMSLLHRRWCTGCWVQPGSNVGRGAPLGPSGCDKVSDMDLRLTLLCKLVLH
jgi:hypothetical protein